MTSPWSEPLLTVAELATSLQRTPPTADSIEERTWVDAILSASNQVRDAVGQPITASTVTVDLDIDRDGYVHIPFVPCRSITEVVIDDVVSLTPADWRLADDRRYLWVGWPCSSARVTVEQGWPDVPGELKRWIRMLAAAQIAQAGTGVLGMGGPTSISVDDARIGLDASGGAVTIPDDAKDRLRAMYGGGW